MDASPKTLADLLRLPMPALERLFENGHPVEIERIAGYEFHGRNFGTPAFFARRFRKFRKVFFRDERTGRFGGWNLRTQQNGDAEPWIDAPPTAHSPVEWLTGRRSSTPAHGFFEIRGARRGDPPAPRGALVIDYGASGNPRADVTALLRDVAVCVSEDDHDLLIGRAYLALGPALIRAQGIFALSRGEPIRDHGPTRR